MHVAKGDLDDHLARMERDPDASPEVKASWRTTAGILDEHVRKSVFGRKQPLVSTA